KQIANAFPSDSAAIASCNALPDGVYSVNVILPNPGNIQEQAWVFPPANVFLKGNPTTGNILTNGTQQVSGNEITVLGDNAVNAINSIITGDVFSGWSADTANAANFTIVSPSSPNSVISIMGDGILTATFAAPAACTTVVNNQLLNFGTVALGQSTSTTQKSVNVKNTGTATANINLEGTSWQFGAASYLSQNTVWTSNDLGSTGKLSGTFVDTTEQAIHGSSNVVYFGTSVPLGTSTQGNYIQTITVEDSC
ncbi:MAG: hypothetical protein KGH98_03625, partial [Candidatus Micrarchaeota archaeon]|nr:hypothetical protein [Candidatus Micrarchaeota archaeon]